MELQTTKASLAACEVVLFVPCSSCKSVMNLVDHLGQTTPEIKVRKQFLCELGVFRNMLQSLLLWVIQELVLELQTTLDKTAAQQRESFDSDEDSGIAQYTQVWNYCLLPIHQ
jgi:hypothetical protein